MNSGYSEPISDVLTCHRIAKELDLYKLKWAIQDNNIDEVNRLIEGVTPSKLNQVIDSRYTPLYWASYWSQTGIVGLLLSAGANPNIGDIFTLETTLHKASVLGQTEMVIKLLSANADPNIVDTHRETPLYRACAWGNTEIVKLLLSAGADPNIADTDNKTPLFRAFFYGSAEIMELLLLAGAEPNMAPHENMESALHLASALGRPKLVKYLLSAGFDANIIDRWNQTPLYWASARGWIEIVELLLSAGADPDIANYENRTPYDAALDKKYMDISSILENWKGLDPNKITDDGRIVLMDLIINGYYSPFKILLPQVKNINAQDNNGNTALHYAIIYKRKNMIQELLRGYASTDISNDDYKIVLDYALEILKKDKDDTYIRELYRVSRKFLYGGIYYQEAKSHFNKALEQKDIDPLLIDPTTLDKMTLLALAEALSLFKTDGWELPDLYREILKIQAALHSLSSEERDIYLEDLYIKYIKDNYT